MAVTGSPCLISAGLEHTRPEPVCCLQGRDWCGLVSHAVYKGSSIS
ncbi:hypothetical protein Cadr_000010457 [Camelus dromedarius]|uniref:Uncharacterized protein n=1 Tax=Camelus dromedarius TaxID=9838 RepID=A0A5N4DXG6_CAMDR|nr:hypothetical protein Cadr_000010457 [Camelus dromedarius]